MKLTTYSDWKEIWINLGLEPAKPAPSEGTRVLYALINQISFKTMKIWSELKNTFYYNYESHLETAI